MQVNELQGNLSTIKDASKEVFVRIVKHEIKNVGSEVTCWLKISLGQRIFKAEKDNANDSFTRKCIESGDSTRYVGRMEFAEVSVVFE